MKVSIRITATPNVCHDSDCARAIKAGDRIVYVGEGLLALCMICANDLRIGLVNEFASLPRRAPR